MQHRLYITDNCATYIAYTLLILVQQLFHDEIQAVKSISKLNHQCNQKGTARGNKDMGDTLSRKYFL